MMTFISCQKNSNLIKAAAVMKLSVTSFSTDAEVAFTVIVNDKLVEDSLYNGLTSINLVAKTEGMQHILIRNNKTQAQLLDTLLDMPGNITSLTLLQLVKDGSLMLTGKPEGEIPEKQRLQAFYYINDILPDSLAFQVYACHFDPNTFALLKTDTIATYPKIKKGELSEYRMIADSPDPSSIYYFFQPLDTQTLQPLPNMAMPFDPANFMGYLFNFDPTQTGMEQHYINNIFATGTSELFDLFSSRLIAY